MRLKRIALLFVLLCAQAALAVPLAITTLGVSTSTPTTATITWTTTGTSAAADTRVSYTGGGVTSAYIDGSRVTSHSAVLTGLQPGVVYTYTASSQSATETATGTAATFSLCRPNSGKLTAVKATLYSFYAYGAFTATWHDLSGIGTTPTQCGVAITTPVSGTLDINGNLSVALPDVNQVTPSVGAWTIAFSSFASTGSVSVDISPTGQNFDASATIQAQVTSGNRGPVGGSGGVGSGTVTSVSGLSPLFAVASPTTTPTFSLSTFAAHKFYGNNTGSTATPGAQSVTEDDVTNLTSDLALKAPLASPTFTGTPAAPTATVGTNTTQLATTAFVLANAGSAGALVQLETHTAANSASLSFTTCLSGTYNEYMLKARGLIPVSSGGHYALQFSTNAGVSYTALGSIYDYVAIRTNSGGSAPAAASNQASMLIDIGGTPDNTANLGMTADWAIKGVNDSIYKRVQGVATSVDSGGFFEVGDIGGVAKTASVVNALQITNTAGNFAGTITCYGVTGP